MNEYYVQEVDRQTGELVYNATTETVRARNLADAIKKSDTLAKWGVSGRHIFTRKVNGRTVAYMILPYPKNEIIAYRK